MILNVSGRTDIVAFYSTWFMKRYNDGYVDVRNPFNRKLVSRIFFKDVDLIMFCTKNPEPILKYLSSIDKPILFHVTLTPYKEDIEVNVDKTNILDSIKKLSEIVGIDNLYVRYDPIFVSDKYTLDYHVLAFRKLCKELDGYVKNFIVSFIDDYKNVRKNMPVLRYRELGEEDYRVIGESFSEAADKIGATVQTCFEERTLVEYGFIRRDCIDEDLVMKLTGLKGVRKWRARKGGLCNCVELVDIGDYNTCSHFCKYCYANYNEKLVLNNNEKHDVNSSLLIGHIESDDVIKVRKK